MNSSRAERGAADAAPRAHGMRFRLARITFAVTAALVPAHSSAQPAFLFQWGRSGFEAGRFNLPFAIAIDAGGNVYVGDYGTSRIEKFTGEGAYLTQWAIHGMQLAPLDLKVDSNGDILAADGGNNRVLRFSSDGALLGEWPTDQTGFNPWNTAVGLAISNTGVVYVVDGGNDRIQAFTRDGALVCRWGKHGSGPGEFNGPRSIALAGNGILYVADIENARVQKFDEAGTYLGEWAAPREPLRIAVDESGLLLMTQFYQGRVGLFTTAGAELLHWAGSGSAPGQFDGPSGVAVGNDGRIYIVDTYNFRVEVFGPVATPTSTASWGRLKRLYR
jgi:DNA-binding beta-propeller fold protein YncE